MGFLQRLFKGRKSEPQSGQLLEGHSTQDASPSLPQGRSSLPLQATAIRTPSSGNGPHPANESSEYHESVSYDIPYGYDIPQPQLNTQKLNDVGSLYSLNSQKAPPRNYQNNGLPPKSNGREPFALYNPPTQEIHSTVVCNLGELEAQSPLIHDYQVKIRKEEVRLKQQRVFKGRYEKKNENVNENGSSDIFNRYTPPQAVQNVDILSRTGPNGAMIENSWNGNRTVPLSPMVRLNNSSNQTFVNKDEAFPLPKPDLEVKNVYTLLKPTSPPTLKQPKQSAFVIPDLQADETDMDYDVKPDDSWRRPTENHVSYGAAWREENVNRVIASEPTKRMSILNEDIPVRTQWESSSSSPHPVLDSHRLPPAANAMANSANASGLVSGVASQPIPSSAHGMMHGSNGSFSLSGFAMNGSGNVLGGDLQSHATGDDAGGTGADHFDEIPMDIPMDIPVVSQPPQEMLYPTYQLEGLQEPEHASYIPVSSQPIPTSADPPSHPEFQRSPSHPSAQQEAHVDQGAHYVSSAPKSPSMSVSSLEDRSAFPGSLMAGHLARLHKKQKEWHDHFCVLICKQHDIDFAYLLELFHDRHFAERDENVENIHVTNATIQFVQGTVFTVKTTGELNKKGTTHFLSANSVDETKAWLGAFELVPGAHVSWVGKDGTNLK